MSKTILIKNDDQQLNDTLIRTLKMNGYEVETIQNDDSPSITIVCHQIQNNRVITVGTLTLDLDSLCVYNADRQQIHFTPIEFSMMAYLMKNKHRAVSRDELLPAVWGFENTDNSRVADDTVKRLRRKLQHTDVSIDTIWKFGFRIRENA